MRDGRLHLGDDVHRVFVLALVLVQLHFLLEQLVVKVAVLLRRGRVVAWREYKMEWFR